MNTARLLRFTRETAPPVGDDPPDTELLRRYAAERDEAAFAELVRRNGPLVLRTCRNALGEAGSEDAFQATFLLLARSAGRLTRPGSLAGWLHAAAVRIACRARRAEGRRREHEIVMTAQPVAPDDLTWREVREVLDSELAVLPEKYRVPLVLCYLQELSYEEAARRAGCPVGALRGRLERGKEQLRKRLAKYGLSLAAPVLVLGRPPALSAALTESTLGTARAWATGGAVPRAVADLLAPAVRLKAGLVVSAVGLVSLVALAGGIRPAEPSEPDRAPEPRAVVLNAPAARLRTDLLGDPLPPGAVMRLGTRRFQVSTWPVKPVPLPGGAHYLTHHTDAGWARRTELRWMDAASGVVTAAWPVPTGHHVAGVSADGKWAVSAKTKFFTTGARIAPEPKTAPIAFTLHDLSARKEVQLFACESDETEGAMAQVQGAIVSADGKWVATVNNGDSTGRIRLWRVGSEKPVWASALTDLNGPMYTPLGFTLGGAELVLRASKDNRIDIVDTTQFVVARSFPTMTEQVDGQALAPDGSAVILGTYSPKVRIWDVKTGKERASLEGHKEWARRFAFTPDGKALVTGGNDSYLLVRDWPSGAVRKRVELGRGAVQALFVSGDGKHADVLFWWESALVRYDLETGKPVPRSADTHRAPVVAVAAAPDGSVLSVGVDKVLRAWNPGTGRQLRSSPLDPGDGTRPQTLAPDGTVSDLCVLSPDGRLRAGPGPTAGTVSVENVKTRAVVATLDARAAGWWTPTAVPAFSPDGRLLAVADGGSVRLWTVNGWREAGSVPATTSALDFSPDGRSLVTADLNDVTVWEVATRRVRATVAAGSQLPTRPRFSPDGRFLAWAVRSEAIEVWDVRRGRMAATFRGHEGTLRDFVFTSDGRALVTASDDGTLLVWDVVGGAGVAPGTAVPGERQVREAWDDLGSSDPVRAFAGVRVLASAPDRMVPLVRTGVKPAAPVDAVVVERLLANLASETFATREAATAELTAAGDMVEGKVRAFLAATPSAEARSRAEQVLGAISGPSTTAVRRRELRAIEALEWAGTAGAKDLLRALAKGAPDARLTRDAATALRRVGELP